MQEKDPNKRQMIVNDGIIYNKRDMLMLIYDLGTVTYYEVVDGKVLNQGKGTIIRVCHNSDEPTLFLPGRIYVNIGAFDYLKVSKISDPENTLFELVNEGRTIKLIPDATEKPQLSRFMIDNQLELEGMFPPDFDTPVN